MMVSNYDIILAHMFYIVKRQFQRLEGLKSTVDERSTKGEPTIKCTGARPVPYGVTSMWRRYSIVDTPMFTYGLFTPYI